MDWQFEYKPKMILILGNGFDLAHNLPTRYSDFLIFCHDIMNPNDTIDFKYFNINSNSLLDNYKSLFKKCLNRNLWYNYLYSLYAQKSLNGENWIDFESEISYVIKYIDTNVKNLSESFYFFVDDNLKSITKQNKPDNLSAFYYTIKKLQIETKGNIKTLRELLYDDLNRLIKALEIFLIIVEKIPISVISKDITNCYDYIINFNYTHTYNLIENYNKLKTYTNEPTSIFYIHGELSHKPNNMVLGIDEYWSEKERDSHTNFTIFKKFAQRIQKGTGIKSYEWFDEIKKDYEESGKAAKIFIFGHSLDVTDKDILYDYLESEATDVTIYCRDEATAGEYIANVIKIIGEKRLLEKVNQYPQKLKFVIQQPMVPIEEEEKELSTPGAAP